MRVVGATHVNVPCGALLGAHAEAAQVDGAAQWFHRCEQACLLPDAAATCRTVLNAFANAGKVEDDARWLHKMGAP